jgi:hypothetical protein
VEIRKSDVKKWIKENADEVQGLNDKQAEVVATLALIEANSTDAWNSFQKGAGTADEVLDTFAATLANVKDAAVKGFGGIFVGVVEDILAATDAFGGLPDAADGLTDWIDQNEDKIRSFMIDLIDYALLGAEAFGATAKGALEIAEWLAKAVPDMMRFAAAGIDLSEKMSALWALFNTDIGSKEFGQAWDALTSDASDRVKELEAAADRLDGKLITWDTSGAQDAIDAVTGKIGDVRSALDDLKVADAAIIEIKAELKAKDLEAAEATLAALSEDQLVTLIASIDPTNASKTEKKILELAKGRKVELDTEVANKAATERELARLSRDRVATLWLKPKFGYGSNNPSIGTPVGRSASPLSRAAVPSADQYATGTPSAVLTLRNTAPPVVNIVNNYPKPERASDSLAMSLRLAREAVA